MARTYTAASLVRAYRAAQSWDPGRPFIQTDRFEVLTAQEWLAWFRSCLAAKINREVPTTTGRKHRREWQADMQRVAWKLRNRIVLRYHEAPTFLRDVRARLEHRLADDRD